MKIDKKHIYWSFPLWKTFSPKDQMLLFFLVLVGVSIRIINALYTELWRDEVFIFFTSRENSFLRLLLQQHWDTAHPPLYFLFLHYWQKLSIQPFFLRLPSILASFFFLYLIPVLSASITKKNRLLPFVLLFIFCFSHTQISLQMVARPYPFVSLFMMLSLILFFSLVKENRLNMRKSVVFGFINFLAIATDYSAVWLFISYFFFYLFLVATQRKQGLILPVFTGLLISAGTSLFIFPFLFGNLKQSLTLEDYMKDTKFRPPQKQVVSDKLIYLFYNREKHSLILFDDKFNIMEKTQFAQDIFQDNTINIGLNLAPRSVLKLNSLEFCEGTSLDIPNIQNNYKLIKNGCQNVTKDLLESVRYSKPGVIVSRISFFPYIIHTNKKWTTSLVPITKNSIKTQKNLLFALSFKGYGIQNGIPGINIYGKTTQDNNSFNWWRNIYRLTISAEKTYRVDYYDGASEKPFSLIGENKEKNRLFYFYPDFLFFTSLPSRKYSPYSSTINSAIGIFFITISIYGIIVFFRRIQKTLAVFFFILFFIPPLTSYLISVYLEPIFVARNFFVSTYSYAMGLAIVLSFINRHSLKKVFLFLFSISTVVIFFLAFPYLNYVDMNYHAKQIAQTIVQYPNDKKIIISSNQDGHYNLVRYYQLALSGPDKKTSYFITKKNGVIDTTIDTKEAAIFYLQFREESAVPNGKVFFPLNSVFGCIPKKIPINKNVYFANCVQ